MSGYIGTDPKKIEKAFIKIVDENQVVFDTSLNHYRLGSKLCSIKKAWVGNDSEEPTLVLSADDFLKQESTDVYSDIKNQIFKGNIHGCIVEYNGNIHVLGGSINKNKHYVYDGKKNVIQLIDIPYNFYGGTTVVYDNKIHLIGGYESETYHYSWNGESWTRESTLPLPYIEGSNAIVYNNYIHILHEFSQGSYKRIHLLLLVLFLLQFYNHQYFHI